MDGSTNTRAAIRDPRYAPRRLEVERRADGTLVLYNPTPWSNAFATAMGRGLPIAPVSPQYGLPGADLSRLAHAVEVIRPAAVYVDDAAVFAGALEADFLAGLPVIASRNARSGDVPLETLFAAPPAPP